MDTLLIAKVCYEANKAYCETIGDTTQPSWDDAAEWQQKSVIEGIKFHIEHPDAKPEDSHDAWLKTKLADGWKYGPVKDPIKKEHPCFLLYHELPEEQRKKDALFIAVVKALI